MFDNLERFYEARCPADTHYLTGFLLLFHAAPTFIEFSVYAFSLLIPELYLLVLGFGLTFSWLVNCLINWGVGQPVPYPDCSFNNLRCIDPRSAYPTDCYVGGAFDGDVVGPPYLCPSGVPCDPCVECGFSPPAAQQVGFLIGAFLLYNAQWRNTHFKWITYCTFVVVPFISAYAHMHFGFNTELQWISGFALGWFVSILWHAVFSLLVLPYADWILSWSIFSSRGYRNSLCPPAQVKES